MTYSILLVDDEAGVRAALRRLLRTDGYEICEAQSAEQALAILGRRPIDLIISDHRMPSMSGIELLKIVRIRWPDTIRLILTGQADLELAIQAINEDAVYRFLRKPWDGLDLRIIIRLALRHLEMQRENAQLLALVEEQARALRRLHALAARSGRAAIDEALELGATQELGASPAPAPEVVRLLDEPIEEDPPDLPAAAGAVGG